jgi:hypothetical protein
MVGSILGQKRTRSIILDTIVDQILWIWHAFLGLSRGNNDVNVLDKLPFVVELLKGEKFSFMVNGMFYPHNFGVVLCKPYMNPKKEATTFNPNARSTKRC